MSTPLVSIGLPVYNGENYLRQTLDSLLGQTYTQLELVISDNASSDNTAAICREYAAADTRIRYFRHEQNGGGNWNFNFVARQATGKYFKWASHDDLCHPTLIERLVQVLERDPEVVWCHSASEVIDAAGDRIQWPHSGLPSWACEPSIAPDATGRRPAVGRRSPQAGERFAGVLLGRSYCLDIYGLIRRDTLLSTRLMLPFWGPEKVLISELALRGKYEELAEPLFFFRIHDEASSSLPGVQQQANWVGTATALSKLSPRFMLLKGYWTAVRHAPVRWTTRLRCYGAIVRYMIQFRKLNRIVRSAVAGTGIGASGRQLLNEIESSRRPVAATVAREQTL